MSLTILEDHPPPEFSAIERLGAVVIGRNEGDRLLSCLSSLRTLQERLVYVDSGSTDGSVGRASELGLYVLELDVTVPFTAGRARAEGFNLLSSVIPDLDYIMFADGDCEIESGWLDAAVRFLDRHSDVAIACGRRRERYPTASMYNAWMEREWDTALGEVQSCGGDLVMRCTALRQVGGFDTAIVAGEEPELCRRLRSAKWRVVRLDHPMTIHDAAMTRFSQWWQRAIRSGFGYAQGWHKTRGGTEEPPLYRDELVRALFWGGLVPSLSVAGALLHPLLILVWPLATIAQYLRLRPRMGSDFAKLTVAVKHAEFVGALRYFFRAMRGTIGGTINYK